MYRLRARQLNRYTAGSLRMMKVIPLRQSLRKSCGPCCLAMAFKALGIPISESEVIERLGGLRSYGACTVKMARLARVIGLEITAYSFSKRRSGVILEAPDPTVLDRACVKHKFVIMTIDPSALKGLAPSGAVHNILLLKSGRQRCRYIDPADGKMHSVPRRRLLAAWYASAGKASAHSIVLGRGKRDIRTLSNRR